MTIFRSETSIFLLAAFVLPAAVMGQSPEPKSVSTLADGLL